MGNAPLPLLPTALIQIGARCGRAEGRVQESWERQRHLDDINTEIVTMEMAVGLKLNPMRGMDPYIISGYLRYLVLRL